MFGCSDARMFGFSNIYQNAGKTPQAQSLRIWRSWEGLGPKTARSLARFWVQASNTIVQLADTPYKDQAHDYTLIGFFNVLSEYYK